MNIKSITAVAIGALMLSPIAASADNVAASLSASFGISPSGTVDVGATTFVTPQSLSVAAAAGGRVVAGSVATPLSSGAAAGAGSMDDGVAPYASVTNNGGAYEVNVAFAAPGLFAELAALEANLQAQIDANEGNIADLQAQVDALVADLNVLSNDVDANDTAIAVIEAQLNDICGLADWSFDGTTDSLSAGPFTLSYTPSGEVDCTPS